MAPRFFDHQKTRAWRNLLRDKCLATSIVLPGTLEPLGQCVDYEHTDAVARCGQAMIAKSDDLINKGRWQCLCQKTMADDNEGVNDSGLHTRDRNYQGGSLLLQGSSPCVVSAIPPSFIRHSCSRHSRHSHYVVLVRSLGHHSLRSSSADFLFSEKLKILQFGTALTRLLSSHSHHTHREGQTNGG